MRRVTGVSKSTLPEATAAVRHPYRVILSIGGQTIAVDAPSFALANRTQKDWSWCLAASQQGQPELVVSPPAGRSASEWSRVIEREVTTLTITQHIGQAVILHAGAVADDSGQVLVLVAASGVGKSTATLALARRGMRYVTDEAVVIRPDGSIISYPKPLALRPTDADSPLKLVVGPEELGLLPAPQRLKLARIVLLDRKPGTVLPRLHQTEHIDALLELIAQSSSIDRLPRPLRSLSTLVDQCHGVQRLTYSECDDALPLLMNHLFVPARRAGRPVRRPPLDPPSQQDQLWGFLDGRIRRRPGLDIVSGDATEEGALALVANLPARLSPLGRLLWQACRQPATPDQLLGLATAELGHHANEEVLLSQALTNLCDAEVLAQGFPTPLATLMSHGSPKVSVDRSGLHGTPVREARALLPLGDDRGGRRAEGATV